MSDELYKKHRPQTFGELVGQDEAVKLLTSLKGAIPHCLLLSGPSGCGKTTTARILKTKLKCSDMDFTELNIADVRGIDTIREIRSMMNAAPIGGKCRIWLLDETARATVDAQNALLKILEDTPEHVYFFLATTEPQKLLATIRTRATEIKLRLLKPPEMEQLLNNIAKREDFSLDEDVRDKIVESAEGSPRKALVLLNQVYQLADKDDQLAAVMSGAGSPQVIELCRALINPKGRWPTVAKIVKELEEEPESVRRAVLGYAASVLLGGGNLADRAYKIILCFEKDYFASGRAGLAASCYEVFLN